MRIRNIVISLLVLSLVASCQQESNQRVVKNIISTKNAPAAVGPYSQAIKVGNTLYCSGQIAIDPQTGELVNDTIENETRQVLDNLGAVLREGDMDYSDVVRATVYMSDIENYGKINTIYAQYFKEKPPSRAAVQVGNLPKNVNVEISCIAIGKK